jgi:hypothetical protein
MLRYPTMQGSVQVQSFLHRGRTFSYTTDIELRIPKSTTADMIKTIHEWSKIFPKEETYPQNTWGVPTMLVRFDGVLEGDKFRSYELENTPGGAGYASIVSPIFKKNLDRMRSIWPPVAFVDGWAPNKYQDEHLWLPEITLEQASKCDVLLSARVDTRIGQNHFLGLFSRRLVSPLLHRHDKSYGEKLGWWRKISSPEEIPWEESFAIKPVSSYHAKDVYVWGRGLKASRGQVMTAMKKHGSMYLQPFISPMDMTIGGKIYSVMLRPYFGFDPRSGNWEPLGGMWVGRPPSNARLHWASDALSGPLIVERP